MDAAHFSLVRQLTSTRAGGVRLFSAFTADIKLLDAIQVLVVTSGGIFAFYQYVKKVRFDRFKETPIIHLVLRYQNISKEDLETTSFFYKFIDLSQPQDSNIYRYSSNSELAVNDDYVVVEMVSSNNIPAYNTWITLSDKYADVKALVNIHSHYSIIDKDANGRLSTIGTYALTNEYQKLIGKKLSITYQNIFREKFYDEFEVSKNGKIKKTGTYRILELFFGRVVYKKKLRI
ncbi:MAG: hypothetical protein ABL920_00055 [Methylotenera sp.]